MSNADLTLHSEYLFKLLRASLSGEAILTVPAEIDLKKIFYLAKLHSVAPAVYPAIKKIDSPVVKLFHEDYQAAWRKNAVQYIELCSILSKTDEFGIDCIPLKGFEMKNLYPSPEMRTMADIDFLFDHRKIGDIRLIMYALGYTVNEDSPNHYSFYKEPVMNVEFHPELFKKNVPFASHFNPGWRFSKNTGKGKPVRELTNEGVFIYLIAHLTQHFQNGGAGIRPVMDIWLFLKKYDNVLDWRFINTELRRAGIYIFCNNIKDLSEMWFGSGTASPLLKELGDFIIKSGTYGLRSTHINSSLNTDKKFGKNKLKYFFGTIFPPFDTMAEKYPYVKKHPILLPVGWLARDISILREQNKEAKDWLNNVTSVDAKTIKEQFEMYKRFGL